MKKIRIISFAIAEMTHNKGFIKLLKIIIVCIMIGMMCSTAVLATEQEMISGCRLALKHIQDNLVKRTPKNKQMIEDNICKKEGLSAEVCKIKQKDFENHWAVTDKGIVDAMNDITGKGFKSYDELCVTAVKTLKDSQLAIGFIENAVVLGIYKPEVFTTPTCNIPQGQFDLKAEATCNWGCLYNTIMPPNEDYKSGYVVARTMLQVEAFVFKIRDNTPKTFETKKMYENSTRDFFDKTGNHAFINSLWCRESYFMYAREVGKTLR